MVCGPIRVSITIHSRSQFASNDRGGADQIEPRDGVYSIVHLNNHFWPKPTLCSDPKPPLRRLLLVPLWILLVINLSHCFTRLSCNLPLLSSPHSPPFRFVFIRSLALVQSYLAYRFEIRVCCSSTSGPAWGMIERGEKEHGRREEQEQEEQEIDEKLTTKQKDKTEGTSPPSAPSSFGIQAHFFILFYSFFFIFKRPISIFHSLPSPSSSPFLFLPPSSPHYPNELIHIPSASSDHPRYHAHNVSLSIRPGEGGP